jgi:hypothetical protein
MERENNIPPLRQSSAEGGAPAADLFGRLDVLNGQVTEFMNDPALRRMALEVGIVLLAKRYPALGVLLGAFMETGVKKAPRHAAVKKPLPAKKKGLGF